MTGALGICGTEKGDEILVELLAVTKAVVI